jgi:putative lipoic acid-binding regulatory protein
LTDAERKRAQSIELLEANHAFPCDFPLSVIALNDPAVAAAVIAAVEEGLAAPLPAAAREVRPSAGGKYVSHRLNIPCVDAAHVLAIYARLRAVEGVVSVL